MVVSSTKTVGKVVRVHQNAGTCTFRQHILALGCVLAVFLLVIAFDRGSTPKSETETLRHAPAAERSLENALFLHQDIR
jgi:hypothetical protein